MKKALSIVLALMLVLALFAGCGGSDKTEETAAPTDAATSTPEETETPAQTEDVGEPIVLKVNNFGPGAVPFGVCLEDAAAKVDELSNGNVTFEIYHDGTLLGFNEAMQGVGQGVADISWIGCAAMDAVTDLSSVFTTMRKYLPSDAKDTSAAMRQLIQEVPEIQEEMANLNTRWVGCYGLFGASLHCNGVTPKVPEDLKGVAVDALGGASEYFTLMGANGMTMDPGDWYLNLERGVTKVEATHWPGCDGYKLVEVVDYHLVFGRGLGSGIFTGMMGLAMNLDVYNSLTDQQRQWIWDAFEYGGDLACDYDVPSAEAAIKYCEDDGDTLVYVETEEDMAPWAAYMDEHNANWAAEVDANGWPGTETLAKFDELLAQYE
jgi:TRAP-type C4-dicarboxylate transport system substrate-binding protein